MPTDTMKEAAKVERMLQQPTEQAPQPQADWKSTPQGEDLARAHIERSRLVTNRP